MRKRRAVRTVAVLPSLLTLGNGFCGFLALAYVADAVNRGQGVSRTPDELLVGAAWLIFLAMVFDALDGSIARLTKADSAFGAELDSLCDVITFGLVPAYFVKVMAQLKEPSLFANHPRIALWFTGLYVMCSILRLARYNVENITGRKGPTHFFVGLPTPAAAGVLASLVLLHFEFKSSPLLTKLLGEARCEQYASWILVGLPFLTAALGLLMVSRVPFAHMLNRLTRGRQTIAYVVVLIFCLIVAVFFKELALVLVFGGYVAVSAVFGVLPGPWSKRSREMAERDDEDAFDPGGGGILPPLQRGAEPNGSSDDGDAGPPGASR